MQDNNENNPTVASGDQVVPSTDTAQDKLVPSKVVEDYRRDMHKYKSKAKEVSSRLAELEAKLKADEEAKMVEKQEWQKLYEQSEQEKKMLAQRLQDSTNKHLNTSKLSALKGELGGNVSDIYLKKLANLDSIIVSEDGSIDSESLAAAANEFRNEHGQLIPKASTGNITNPASPSNLNPSLEKDLSSLSSSELLLKYAELAAKK